MNKIFKGAVNRHKGRNLEITKIDKFIRFGIEDGRTSFTSICLAREDMPELISQVFTAMDIKPSDPVSSAGHSFGTDEHLGNIAHEIKRYISYYLNEEEILAIALELFNVRNRALGFPAVKTFGDIEDDERSAWIEVARCVHKDSHNTQPPETFDRKAYIDDVTSHESIVVAKEGE